MERVAHEPGPGPVGGREEFAETLRNAFPTSSGTTQRALLFRAEIRTFRGKQTVVDQGEDTRIGLILDGHIGFRRTTVDGREVMPRIGSRGDMAPFMPIAGRPSTTEGVALTPSCVAFWPAGDVLGLAAGDAGFAVDILQHVMIVFEEVVERMDGLLYQNARRRVARVLDQHSDILFGEEAVVTRAYLPALVGTSREMTGRVLRQLESEGVVQRIGRDRLRLLDATGLARTAAAPSSGRG